MENQNSEFVLLGAFDMPTDFSLNDEWEVYQLKEEKSVTELIQYLRTVYAGNLHIVLDCNSNKAAVNVSIVLGDTTQILIKSLYTLQNLCSKRLNEIKEDLEMFTDTLANIDYFDELDIEDFDFYKEHRL